MKLEQYKSNLLECTYCLPQKHKFIVHQKFFLDEAVVTTDIRWSGKRKIFEFIKIDRFNELSTEEYSLTKNWRVQMGGDWGRGGVTG